MAELLETTWQAECEHSSFPVSHQLLQIATRSSDHLAAPVELVWKTLRYEIYVYNPLRLQQCFGKVDMNKKSSYSV